MLIANFFMITTIYDESLQTKAYNFFESIKSYDPMNFTTPM